MMSVMISVKSAFRSILSIRTGKVVKTLGYTSLFMVLFTVFLVMSLPLERFTGNIETLLEGTLNRKVHIGNISTALTGGIVLSSVEIGAGKSDDSDESNLDEPPEKEVSEDETGEEKEKKPKKQVINYLFDEIAINLGLFSFLFGNLDVSADVTGLGGEISIAYNGPLPKGEGKPETSSNKRTKRIKKSRSSRRSKRDDAPPLEDDKDAQSDVTEETEDESPTEEEEPLAVSVKMTDVQLKQIHDLRSVLPVPLAGDLNLEMTLESETSGFGTASGRLTFLIKDVVLSRKGYEASIMGSSLIVPKLNIDSIEGEIEFKEGIGKVTKFKMVSRDVDMGLEGTITLNNTLKRSYCDLYLTFTIKEKYLGESAAIKTLYSSVDAFSRKMKSAHRSDGYYGFRYRGVFGQGRFSPAQDFRIAGEDGKRSSKKTSRRSRPRSSRRTPSRSQSATNRTTPQLEPPSSTTRTTLGSKEERDGINKPISPPLSSGREIERDRPNMNEINRDIHRPTSPPSRYHRPYERNDIEQDEMEIPRGVPPRVNLNRRHPDDDEEEVEEEEEPEEEHEEEAEQEESEEEEEAQEEEEPEEEEHEEEEAQEEEPEEEDAPEENAEEEETPEEVLI
jgi:hypothetical protein